MADHRTSTTRLRARLPAMAAAAATLGALVLAGTSASAHPSAGDLRSKVNANAAGQQALRSGIQADTATIGSYEGRISDLQSRLGTLQRSLDIEDRQLSGLKARLAAARLSLGALQFSLASDRHALVTQLVAQYESPPPDLTSVVFEARGFGELVERVDQLRTIARRNAQITRQVAAQRIQVAAQTAHLADLEAQQQRAVAAVLVQRDEVAQVKLAAVQAELRFAQARDRKSAQLGSLQARQRSLNAELATVRSEEASAAASPGAAYLPAGAGFSGGAYAPHGGAYGFFPAPGTDYGVGDDPQIAARLDSLGQALQLHLIGISGYRSPSHSVAVGGFPNDPHTRGQASDTPGVEGVPESVLERFGLERPFPGAAEADHIQLLGSPL